MPIGPMPLVKPLKINELNAVHGNPLEFRWIIKKKPCHLRNTMCERTTRHL